MASRSDPDASVLLVPSDHMIADAAAFARAIPVGVGAAEEGAFVIFGIEPDCPHTGYGYIETEKSNSRVLKVRRFVEKPSREAAEEFLDAGNFYWNAGIFLFKSNTLINLFENLAPEVLEACRYSLREATDDLGFLRLSGSYAKAPPSRSIMPLPRRPTNAVRAPQLRRGAMWAPGLRYGACWRKMRRQRRSRRRRNPS